MTWTLLPCRIKLPPTLAFACVECVFNVVERYAILTHAIGIRSNLVTFYRPATTDDSSHNLVCVAIRDDGPILKRLEIVERIDWISTCVGWAADEYAIIFTDG